MPGGSRTFRQLSLMILPGCSRISETGAAHAVCRPLLHDIGWGIPGGPHNEIGMEFVLGDRSLPFSPRERIFVALAVRYHRGALPRKCHPFYGVLSIRDRRIVRLISGIFRVASGLDRSHAGVVRAVGTTCTEKTLTVFRTGTGRGSPERRAAGKKSDMLKKLYATDVLICWRTVK